MNDKETLEEAAEKFRSNNPGTMQGGNNTKILNAFKNGAKWQQEQDKNKYSEEDLEVAFFEGRENNLSFNEWFKQFKKK